MADDAPSPEDLAALQEEIASFSVDQFIVSTASTVASLAYTKLERGDLPEAKKAIDTLQSLVPLVEGPLQAQFQLALSKLQVDYAGAATG